MHSDGVSSAAASQTNSTCTGSRELSFDANGARIISETSVGSGQSGPPPTAGAIEVKLRSKSRRRRGNSFVEVALLAPWIFFLFVGVLDFGFYAYSFIATENAARAAALLTSRSQSSANDPNGTGPGCAIVLAELYSTANGRQATNCGTAPVVYSSVLKKIGSYTFAEVTVTYSPVVMIPIPGVFNPGGNIQTFTITRQVRMAIDPTADS